MSLQRSSLIPAAFAMLACWHAAFGFDEDVYGEGDWAKYKEGPAWEEQDVVLPPYPDEDNLIRVELSLNDFPFTFWIDGSSLQVGDDRVVRYTGILRSTTGVDNVFYEGVRCSKKEYQRYAYASGGSFKRLENSAWRSVRSFGADRYRSVLMQEFLCPLPGYNREKQILRRIKSRGLRRSF
ncbi:MAG: CNP1-like family protein [Gammaproteobacteria bacterium]|jgi:hypothetical protein